MATNSELWAVDAMSADESLQGRVRASLAKESAAGSIPAVPDVALAAWQKRYEVAAAPGWAGAWLSALAGSVPDPGSDNSVVTDGQIAAQVQAVFAAPEPPPVANPDESWT